MSVYKKLQEARVKFHSKSLKKTGENKFAKYFYFELGDFLPAIQEVFSEVGLVGVCSFTADVATLRVVDSDKPDDVIEFTSPMGSADLKGCHIVQNIGAVETYQRRYLWVAAMEIVEHDVLDATTGKDEPKKAVNSPKAGMSEERVQGYIDHIRMAADPKAAKETYNDAVKECAKLSDAHSQKRIKDVLLATWTPVSAAAGK